MLDGSFPWSFWCVLICDLGLGDVVVVVEVAVIGTKDTSRQRRSEQIRKPFAATRAFYILLSYERKRRGRMARD